MSEEKIPNKKTIIIQFLIAIAIIVVLSLLGPILIYFVKEIANYYTHYPRIYIITINGSNVSKEVIINEINSTYLNMLSLVNNLTNNG